MIAIINYGVGNLFSLVGSLEHLGIEAVVTSDAETIRNADRIILPGVGAFSDAKQKLVDTSLIPVLNEEVKKGKQKCQTILPFTKHSHCTLARRFFPFSRRFSNTKLHPTPPFKIQTHILFYHKIQKCQVFEGIPFLYCMGDFPINRLNTRLKYAADSNPSLSLISSMLSSSSPIRSSVARSTHFRSLYSMGDIPTSERKRL